MEQPHDEITQTLAERMCWQVARRDDTRIGSDGWTACIG